MHLICVHVYMIANINVWRNRNIVKFLLSFDNHTFTVGGAQWPSGRTSDSGARGQGFDTYLRRVVSLSKDTFTPRKVLVILRKRWLRPNMTGKLFTGMLSLNTNENQTFT